MMNPHEQGKFRKNEFTWDYSSTGLESMMVETLWKQEAGGRYGHCSSKLRMHISNDRDKTEV